MTGPEHDLIDFDAMVARSLYALQRTPELSHIIAARYPWLAVDEYQDLGPVLHKIVVHLRDTAGAQVFCVGDPDQSVMGFTGADPRYLLELERRTDFLPVKLVRNYRSGSAILAAAERALGERRGYEPAREAHSGLVQGVAVAGGMADHGRAAAECVSASLARGVPPHEVAVLYTGRGPLLTALISSLDAAGIEFIHDRDQKLPRGPLTDFVQACAARSVAGPNCPQPCGWPGTSMPKSVVLPQLVDDYLRLLRGADGNEIPFHDAARRVQLVSRNAV